jgi:Glyoxalase superfamily protein
VDEEVVPVLRVEDAARAVAWYERLGFRKEWEHQFEPGFPWFVCVARGRVKLYLSEHKGDAARTRSSTCTSVTSMRCRRSSESLSMKRVLPAASAISKTPMETVCG